MKSSGPKSLGDLLQSGSLGTLAEQGRQRRELTARIRAALPPDEARHLVAAELDGSEELTLTMDSPEWAARVRYRAQGLGGRVKVRVLPRGRGES
jgi:hypothetical protein